MPCDWKKVKGSGHDEPPIYACEESKSEDIADCDFCCTKCDCSCWAEEEENRVEMAVSALTSELSRSMGAHSFAADIARGTKIGKEGQQIMAKALLRLRLAAYEVIDAIEEENS